MKRRDFLKKAGVGVAAAAAGITGLVGCAKEEEKKKEAAAPAVVTKQPTSGE
jgi:anaerobic selenocysteine-containing dehydrogenase